MNGVRARAQLKRNKGKEYWRLSTYDSWCIDQALSCQHDFSTISGIRIGLHLNFDRDFVIWRALNMEFNIVFSIPPRQDIRGRHFHVPNVERSSFEYSGQVGGKQFQLPVSCDKIMSSCLEKSWDNQIWCCVFWPAGSEYIYYMLSDLQRMYLKAHTLHELSVWSL